jgi:predicted ATPase/DNA-binding SARP family transcriptional activator
MAFADHWDNGSVKIAVLGPLEVRGETSTIEVPGARLRLLLTVLALESPRSASASALVDTLWGDEPPADQSNALQSLVSRLRRTLGTADLIQQSPAGYRLTVAPDDVDLHRFDRLARDGRDALRAGDGDLAFRLLGDALALWRGEPVELAASGHADALLARLEEQRLDVRADLIETRLLLGNADDVIADLEGLLAAHPLRQRFAVLLIRALHSSGRQSEALASYERTRAVLADQLGVDPSAELQAAHLEVLRDDQTPATAAVRRTNLRAVLTSFVGRDVQLTQIADLLTSGRLVTLVGPGGAGKTRLAVTAAALMADAASDGVWLVELAPVTDPADVPQTVLGSLGLRDAVLLERASAMTARDAMTRLIGALAPQSALLVLDNCEHLVEAAAHLADQLLASCPGLRILATSREPLGIFGESLVVVPPLGQPDPDADAAHALTFPAVQLFVDRAADVQPGFEVDESTVAAVIQIVRRLDGLPLAIELAAARLRALPVAEIEHRLSDRFRLLTGGSRTAMPRHRTLRAVVEWSWDLLSASERLLAERLAVFSGGITPRAAAKVCSDNDLSADDVDDLLMSLVDKSLLQLVASAGTSPRYRMLETIREFGLERMAERGEVGRIRLAHAQHFAALVAEADPHLRREEQLEWMALLSTERDNILAAVKYFGDDSRADEAITLVNLLGWYWMTVGSHSEIVTWMSYALAVDGDADPGGRLMSEAFLAISAVAWDVKGTHDEVAAGLEQLTSISERMADAPPDSPKMLALLAPVVAMFVGDRDQVGPLTERAMNHEDPWIAAAVRTFRASMSENDGDVEAMRVDAEISLAAFRTLGERWGMANSLQLLGELELVEGNLPAAAAAYGEALELAAAIGGRDDVALMRMRLADILTRQGDPAAARGHIDLARVAAVQTGSPFEVLFTHIVEVNIARDNGDLAAARRLGDDAIARLRELPAVHPVQGHGLALILSAAAKIELDDGEVVAARRYVEEAYEMAVGTKDLPIVAMVGVAVAMLAVASERLADAAEILGAAAKLRGAEDPTEPDIVRMNERLAGLLDGPYAADYAKARRLERDAAIARLNPASLTDEQHS